MTPGSPFKFDSSPENPDLVRLVPQTGEHDNRARAIYYDFLNFCGCGNPEDVRQLLLAALEDPDPDRQRTSDGRTWSLSYAAMEAWVAAHPSETVLFILYCLDAWEFTEHGGSVYGAWRTDRGQQVLEILKEESLEEEE